MHDLRYGLRTLAQNPGFAAIATLMLALGIGANTSIFTFVNAYLLRPAPFPEAERLAFLTQTRLDRNLGGSASWPDYLDWRAQNQVFTEMAALRRSDVNLTGEGEPERLRTYSVTASLFATLGVKPALGRGFLPEEDRPGGERVVMIGYGLWQRRYGGRADALGRKALLDGEPHTVIGVAPAGFRLQAGDAEALRPLALGPADGPRGAKSLLVVARLKPGIGLERAQADMSAIASRLAQQHPGTNAGWGVAVESFRERFVRNARRALTILMTAVSLVLAIVCVNVANLLLARSLDRRKEVAIRSALGAGRLRIARQMLTESLLIAAMGGALGAGLAVAGVRAIGAMLTERMFPLSGPITMDATVLGYAALVSLATALVFGLAPAFTASRAGLSAVMNDGQRGGHAASRPRLRGALVTVEIALAVVIMVGTGVTLRSFLRLVSEDPGFLPENMLTTELTLSEKTYATPERRGVFIERAVERIAAAPGIHWAAAASALPMTGWSSNHSIGVEGRTDETHAGFRSVTPDYFRAMGIPLLAGRALSKEDRAGAPPVAVVNQTMARRFWPEGSALGKRFKLGGPASERPWITVVGVAGNAADSGFGSTEWSTLFLSCAQEPPAVISIVARTAMDPASAAGALREAVRETDPNQPMARIRTYEQIVEESMAVPRFLLRLLGVFAALALTLAGVGLYGVVAYSVNQRRHELGVRIALGARPARIVALVLRQGMTLAAAGLAVGAAGGWGVAKLLSSWQEGIEPRDPLTFALVTAALGAVAAAACIAPARRATRVDPIAALRQL